ncbi:hypothetical protein B0H14DRAFT_2811040, partial [Mycena olivaceomarginata]
MVFLLLLFRLLLLRCLGPSLGERCVVLHFFYGTILWGAAVALMLNGIVPVHCIIFFKLYPDELSLKTAMVATVWLDAAQSAFILALFPLLRRPFRQHQFYAEKICRCTGLRPLLRNSRLIPTKYVPASK